MFKSFLTTFTVSVTNAAVYTDGTDNFVMIDDFEYTELPTRLQPIVAHANVNITATNTLVQDANFGTVLNTKVNSGTTAGDYLCIAKTDYTKNTPEVLALPNQYVVSFNIKAVGNAGGIAVNIEDSQNTNNPDIMLMLAGAGFEVGDWYEYNIHVDRTKPAITGGASENTTAVAVYRRNLTDSGAWQLCEPIGSVKWCQSNAATGTPIFTVANGGYRVVQGSADAGQLGFISDALVTFGFAASMNDGGKTYATDNVEYQIDNVKAGYGTLVDGVAFDTDTIPASGTVKYTANTFSTSTTDVTGIKTVMVGYDANNQVISAETVDGLSIAKGSNALTATIAGSGDLARIEAFVLNADGKVMSGSNGVLGTAQTVGSTDETAAYKSSTKANAFTIEGNLGTAKPVTVIVKGNTSGKILAITQFDSLADGDYKVNIAISDAISTADTAATATVYGVDTVEKTFTIPVKSNWDAMVADFTAMTTSADVASFYSTYDSNFDYYENGVFVERVTGTLTSADCDSIALLKSKRSYENLTPENVVDVALDLVASLSDIATFEADFAAAKAEATEAEQIAAIKDLITTTTLITFDFDGVFNKDAVAKALISSTATSLADIYNDFITARDTQKGIEQSTATAFRAVTDAATLEAFFVDNQTTLGIDPTPFAGYWEVMYGVYVEKNYRTCADADINTAILFLGDYVDDYKVFMENITRAAQTNKNWEAIKAVLKADNGNVTITLAAGTGTVVETDEIYKRLVDMDCTNLATIEAAYTAAWTEQVAVESTIHNEVSWNWYLGIDETVVENFFNNYGEMLGVPAAKNYTETQRKLFVEMYNINMPMPGDYATTKTEIQTLVAGVTAAEAFIADVNVKAAADDRAGVEAVYEGAAYAGYFGAPAISVTDERELYTRIIDIAKETPFAVLADVKAAFVQAHADQLTWEAQSGAYEGADDALLDFVSTAWKLDIKANIITISGKVDAMGVQRVALLVKDGADTGATSDDDTILLKQVSTEEDGKFTLTVGLNPNLYTAGAGAGKIKIGGAGINTYAFAPINLYSGTELDAAVAAFKSIATKQNVIDFFDNHGPMLGMDLTIDNVNTYSDADSVAEVFLFAYNKAKTAGQFASFEDNYDIINGISEGPTATDIIEEMKAMVACLDALTEAANEQFGDSIGRWANIQAEVEKAINNGWISTAGTTGTVTNEDAMYIRMAGKTYKYMTTPTAPVPLNATKVDAEYISAYNTQAALDGAGGGAGGGGNADDKVINSGLTDNAPVASNPANHPAAPFTDITAEFSWAKGSIDALRKYGIIKGDGDGKFRPGSGISREEFLSILLRVFEVDVKQGSANFNDVNKNEWYYDTVSTAYNMGVVKGYPNGNFGIGDTISRADMAVMICRMMEIQGVELNPTLEGFIFKDYADIPSYAYDYVIKLQTAEVLNGDTFGYFNPLNNVTRAESAVAFWSVYKKVSNFVDYVK